MHNESSPILAGSRNNRHGDHCACVLLAAAVGCKPAVIPFEYCRTVLMKRWRLECNHGCCGDEPVQARSEKWHDVGPIDPVKAILIKNE